MYRLRILLVVLTFGACFVISVGVGLWDNTIRLPILVQGLASIATVLALWYVSWEDK